MSDVEICEKPRSPLVPRLTLIIVAIFAIFILINCAWNLFLLNKVNGTGCNLTKNEVNNVKILNALGIIGSILVLCWVAYGILAPEGSWKDYLRPFGYTTETVINTTPKKLKRGLKQGKDM